MRSLIVIALSLMLMQGVPPNQLPRLTVADPAQALLIVQQGQVVYSIVLSNLTLSAGTGMTNVIGNLVITNSITLNGSTITAWPTGSSQIILDEANAAPVAPPTTVGLPAFWTNPIQGKTYSWSVQLQQWIPTTL